MISFSGIMMEISMKITPNRSQILFQVFFGIVLNT